MKTPITENFDSLRLTVASPEQIREWSYGEVAKAETINYRTGRAERGGLFDERVFGPTKDYECYCGKYRRIRYKNIICEKCGVEVTRSIVRRERMGHIELASPVAHIWFLRGIPSRIGMLLNLSLAEVEKVIYFAGYIVTNVHEEERGKILRELANEFKSKTKTLGTKKEKSALEDLYQATEREIKELRVGQVLDEAVYHRHALRYSTIFSAGIGAEAIHELAKTMDIAKEIASTETALETASPPERIKLHKRLGILKSMKNSGVRPEWMFLTAVPVMPPMLRPMVALEGGRHATSDVNDLYRRVINRNNRLRKLIEISAPDVILRNEKRILQEAMDALLDNAMRRGSGTQIVSAAKRELKSISENLKGKQGLFRQNLLGKRVDYSGRSVIVVGPNLKLSQCGLPKHMALELFRPFVIAKLLERELAFNIRGAGRLIEEGIPEVWAILEEVIKGKYVLLNRAPTLHRLGVQAFQPVLIEGNAIELHPLVCPAFNADFDGDQMAVHVPLSPAAQKEARELMAADKNILKPGNGDPTISAKMLDIVLGCYWVTTAVPRTDGAELKYFSSPNIAITVHDFGGIELREPIKVKATATEKYKAFAGGILETTIGRLLFNSILPSDYPFVNKEVDRKMIAEIVDNLIERYGIESVAPALDKIKSFGFGYATRSGITWSLEDMKTPDEKAKIVESGWVKASEIDQQFNEGLLSRDEWHRKNVEVWQLVKMEIEQKMPTTLQVGGSVYDIWKSGARGQISQITQMAGMKGLIADTVGRTLPFPIVSSYKEGLTPLEYFVTTHGARYGLTSTALQTAKAGYLTRRLVDVAQDCVIMEEDCGDKTGRIMSIKPDAQGGFSSAPYKWIGGRVLLKDLKDGSGAVVAKKGTVLRKADVAKIEKSGIEEVAVRTPLSCKAVQGLCRLCYGLDLGRNVLVGLGEAVGIVAAQAIGEPGTQLTMRTFHRGGVAEDDITMGLPRVDEIFERRPPKNPAVICHEDGEVLSIERKDDGTHITVLPELPGKKKTKAEAVEYIIPFGRMPIVSLGASVKKGDLLTDGSADLLELFRHAGEDAAKDYIITEVGRIYDLQGASISRKHLEIMVRQMFSRRKIKENGSTRFNIGEVVEYAAFIEENERVEQDGGEIAKAETVLLGISDVALTTKSFLSAASFQNTTRVLIKASLAGAVDELRGLKENVIIGRLIPAGTGFHAGEGEQEIPVAEEVEE